MPYIIFGIVFDVLFIGMTIGTLDEDVFCIEKGGDKYRSIDNICDMNKDICEATDGIPINCIEDVYNIDSPRKCTPGCYFE